MKSICLKQGQNGSFGLIKITETKNEEENILYYKEYQNDIEILNDIKKFVLSEEFIYSYHKKENQIIMKSDEETEIVLEDFTNELLLGLISKKIITSFSNAIDIFHKFKYEHVQLTASHNRTNFDLIQSVSKKRTIPTMFIELELDEDGKLSLLGEEMLKIVKEKELTNWFRLFLSKKENNDVKICYDEKTMTINRVLTDYVSDDVNKQQDLYLNINKKVNNK